MNAAFRLLASLALLSGCAVTGVVHEPDAPCTRQCPARPVELAGTRQPGERCTYAQECLPACCACGADSTETVLVSACRLGFCMKQEDACAPATLGTACADRDRESACASASAVP